MAIQNMSLQDTITLSGLLAKSGYFSDAKGEAQAVVKVLAGRELGFGPVASMTGIHVVQGKPVIGGNLIATLVQAHPSYTYRVKAMTDQECEIAFYEGKEEIGRSRFTMEDANRAGLTTKAVWKQYPRNMLFNRAMSNGVRWYCPAVFAGVPVYTPEELGANVDDNGDIVDVTPTVIEPVPEPVPSPVQPELIPEVLQPAQIAERADKLIAKVNERLGTERYRHMAHALNAIRLEKGDEGWHWPTTADSDTWNALYQILLAHARKE